MRYLFIFLVYFFILSYIIYLKDKENKNSFEEVLTFNLIGHLLLLFFALIIYIFYKFW
jgi:RsiW-degrading membrane proteinase PrsW (M82 family)